MACTVGMNSPEPSHAASDDSRSSDACLSRRFVGVHFTNWLVDLESALLRRAIVRAGIGEMCDLFPLVVVEERSRIHVIIACNHAALVGGVCVGMTLSQAETVCSPQQGAEAAAWRTCIERLRLNGDASSLSSHAGRIVTVSERLIAIEHERRLAARMLVRMGRCLQRWIPVVSVPPELQPDLQVQSCRIGDGASRSGSLNSIRCRDCSGARDMPLTVISDT